MTRYRTIQRSCPLRRTTHFDWFGGCLLTNYIGGPPFSWSNLEADPILGGSMLIHFYGSYGMYYLGTIHILVTRSWYGLTKIHRIFLTKSLFGGSILRGYWRVHSPWVGRAWILSTKSFCSLVARLCLHSFLFDLDSDLEIYTWAVFQTFYEVKLRISKFKVL